MKIVDLAHILLVHNWIQNIVDCRSIFWTLRNLDGRRVDCRFGQVLGVDCRFVHFLKASRSKIVLQYRLKQNILYSIGKREIWDNTG